MTRRCYGCRRRLPLAEFARDAAKGGGHKSICRRCDREKAKRYYEANRGRVLARVKAQQAARAAEE